MSFATIKTQLYKLETAIVGVVSAYDDRPEVAPGDEDCPAVINDYEPANLLRIFNPQTGGVGYEWRFNIKFLLKPIGIDEPAMWDSDIEPYPARLIAKLFSTLSLDGNAMNQDMAAPCGVGRVTYLDSVYFGFALPWIVREIVNVTIGP